MNCIGAFQHWSGPDVGFGLLDGWSLLYLKEKLIKEIEQIRKEMHRAKNDKKVMFETYTKKLKEPKKNGIQNVNPNF